MPTPPPGATASDHLQHIVDLASQWLALSQEQPHRFALVTMMLASPRLVLTKPDDIQPALSAVQRVVAPVARALGRAVDAGALSDGSPIDRSVLLFAGAQGILQLGKSAAHAPMLLDVPRLYAAMVRSLLAGWGAPAGRASSALTPESAL